LISRSLARTPAIALTLTIVAALVALVAPETSERFDLLVLDRDEPHWWSWFSAHVLHTDPLHLAWNVLALLCLGWLGEAESRARFALSIVVGVAAVDAWFAWSNVALRYYCGLSGVLNTVLLVTLYALRRSIAPRWLVAFAVLVAMKLGWEWHSGIALLTHTQWPPAVGAHIAGFGAGLLLVAAYAWRDRAAPL
jgi:membrane associated rhomboid family serine protease